MFCWNSLAFSKIQLTLAIWSLVPLPFLKPVCTSGSFQFSSVQSLSQSCPTLRDPMNHSTPGLPVHNQLPESIQTQIHWVDDAIQPSHLLLSPSPPTLNLSQNQGLFKTVSSLHQVAKILEFHLQHQSFQWTPRTDLLQEGLVRGNLLKMYLLLTCAIPPTHKHLQQRLYPLPSKMTDLLWVTDKMLLESSFCACVSADHFLYLTSNLQSPEVSGVTFSMPFHLVFPCIWQK